MPLESLDYESRADPSSASAQRSPDERLDIGCLVALGLGAILFLIALLYAVSNLQI
jgi:hypothetical protein